MSRIGKKPIPIPQGVKVQVGEGVVRAEGPKGKLSQPIPSPLSATLDGGVLVIGRPDDERKIRALHGLTRALMANMVSGVKDGFERKLDIVGIGYRAQMQGKSIQLALGYSHPVIFPLPDGITAEIDKQTAITLRGADKALLGETAAKLRALRKPDPYKGKGIRYSDEYVRRKVGKKAGAKLSPGTGGARATSATTACGATCAARRRGRGWPSSGASATSTRSSSTTMRGARCWRWTAAARRSSSSTRPAATWPPPRRSARCWPRRPRRPASRASCSIAAATSTTAG